jgi:hypothetical protein
MVAQLTDDIIRALSTPQSFERGQRCYRDGAVFNISRQVDLLIGECQGSNSPRLPPASRIGCRRRSFSILFVPV